MENRAIFAIIVLGVFSSLVIMMGTSFSTNPENYQLIDVPNYLDTGQFFQQNITYSDYQNVTFPSYNEFEMSDSSHNVVLQWISLQKTEFYFTYENGVFLWILSNIERLNPYPLTWAMVLDAYDDDMNASRVSMTSKSNEWTVQYFYNQTAYDNLTHAYDSNDIKVYVGMGNEYDPSSMSAWSFVTSILTWSNPDIHPAVNFLIAIPLYAMFGMILFYMFTKLMEASNWI